MGKIKLAFLAILALFSAVAAIPGDQIGPYSQRFSDEYLDQRLCLSISIGFEYISYSFSAILSKYLRLYNDPESFGFQRDKYDRHHQVKWHEYTNKELEINVELTHVDESVKGPTVARTLDESYQFMVDYPIEFTANSKEAKVSGVIDFGFGVDIQNRYDSEEKKNHWTMKPKVDSEAKVTQFKCSGEKEWCRKVEEYMQKEFVKLFINLQDEHIYDQPQPMIKLAGFLEYINQQAARKTDTLHVHVNSDARNVYFFYNCKKQSVEDVLKHPVKPDYTELSFSQNALDNLGFPDDAIIDLDSIKNKINPGTVFFDNQEKIDMIPSGSLRFTKDPMSISALDHSKFQSPSIKNHTNFQQAKRYTIHSDRPYLDKIAIHQNVFLEVKEAGSDLSIIPLEINFEFLAKGRLGARYQYGQVQEFKTEFVSMKVNMKECQTVGVEKQIEPREFLLKGSESDEDGDDFEEDDEEADGKEAGGAKLKVANVAGLACSMRTKIQKDIIPDFERYLTEMMTLHIHQTGYLAKWNDYYPMVNKWHSSQALCTGVEAKDPNFRFERNRFVISYELNKNAMRTGAYCETQDFMQFLDPRHIYQEEARNERVAKRLAEYEDFERYVIEHKQAYGFSRIAETRFDDHFWSGRVHPSSFVYYFTHYTHLKDWCHTQYPEAPENSTALFYDNCALAHTNERGRNIDPIPYAMYKDFDNQEKSVTIRAVHRNFADVILAVAVVMNLLNFNIKRNKLLITLFVLNMALSFCELFEITMRYGIDYNAYIQQAGAVYNGERDYTMLSSHLGPCYYPAGHIWHYIPAYWIHLQTDHAETIIKFGTHIIHSLLIVFVTKISFVYTRDPKGKDESAQAQFIGLILLANKEDRSMYSWLYNDEIMMLYIVLTIYFAITNRPMWSSLFFTIGLSMKAGVLLLLPSFLGQMQYNQGTVNLIKSLVVIIGFQVLVALPFILGDTSVKDYIHRSKLTGAGRDGVAGAPEFWDYLAAHQSLSILWTFIPEEVYFTKHLFADRVKATMLILNVWHFFIRKWCTPQCFTHLFNTFKPDQNLGVKTFAQARKTTEILVIGYMSGITFMPGANLQFLFWFMSLYPLFIEMVGLPQILTFWMYGRFYPIIEGADPRYQHYVLLFVVVWLNTVGPQEKLLHKIFATCCLEKKKSKRD